MPIDFIALVANDLHQQPRKIGANIFFKCPFHSGGAEKTPSLKISNGDSAHGPGFYCFGCHEKGGAVGYYLKRGYNLDEARRITGIPAAPAQYHAAPAFEPPQEPPNRAWRERAWSFLTYAQDNLTSRGLADWTLTDPKTGQKKTKRMTAIEWLLERGLTIDTAERWRIGYNPKDIWDKRENWGLPPDSEKPKIWLPQGLVIPHLVEQVAWAVKIRRPNGEPKYIHVTGSVPGLYMADNLHPGLTVPIVLTEGEIDALTLWQEAGDLAAVATLGSASSSKFNLATWGLYFMQSDRRFTVFDLDAAGDKGAAPLQDYRFRALTLPRLQPWHKDVNDYYRATGRLREWLQEATE